MAPDAEWVLKLRDAQHHYQRADAVVSRCDYRLAAVGAATLRSKSPSARGGCMLWRTLSPRSPSTSDLPVVIERAAGAVMPVIKDYFALRAGISTEVGRSSLSGKQQFGARVRGASRNVTDGSGALTSVPDPSRYGSPRTPVARNMEPEYGRYGRVGCLTRYGRGRKRRARGHLASPPTEVGGFVVRRSRHLLSTRPTRRSSSSVELSSNRVT
jgi:hypothetical protein